MTSTENIYAVIENEEPNEPAPMPLTTPEKLTETKFPYWERQPRNGVMTYTIHWLNGQQMAVCQMVNQLLPTMMVGEEIRILPASTLNK
jgi:hypothetical protein